MRVFFTGGTGFIGQHNVRKMRHREWYIHALVRDLYSEASLWLADNGCTLVRGDVTSSHGLADAMQNNDVVIHNAGV